MLLLYLVSLFLLFSTSPFLRAFVANCFPGVRVARLQLCACLSVLLSVFLSYFIYFFCLLTSLFGLPACLWSLVSKSFCSVYVYSHDFSIRFHKGSRLVCFSLNQQPPNTSFVPTCHHRLLLCTSTSWGHSLKKTPTKKKKEVKGWCCQSSDKKRYYIVYNPTEYP